MSNRVKELLDRPTDSSASSPLLAPIPPLPLPSSSALQNFTPAPELPPPAEVEPEAPLADAFDALLAAEQGEVVSPNFAITPELLDQLAARVAERMTSDVIRTIVAETSERLIKEEIARIRADAAQTGKR